CQREPLPKQPLEIGLHLRPAQHGNPQQPPLDCQDLESSGETISANHIENDVDAVSAACFVDYSSKVRFAVDPGALGAKPCAGCTFAARASRGKHTSTENPGDLNGGRADPARATVHEKCLAVLQMASIEYVRPHCEERLGNACGGNKVDAGWNRQAL